MDLDSSFQGLSFSYLSEDSECPIISEPDFKTCYFGHLLSHPARIQKLKDFCLSYPNNGHLLFLLAMIYEYGLLGELDVDKAKTFYFKSADQLKNFHACYRLYFVYRQIGKDAKKPFKLGITPNEEKAYYYLIRAGAYSNEMDNRISFRLIDPIMHLYYYLDKFDKNYCKAFALFTKMEDSRSPVYEPNYEYIVAWFQAKYPNCDQDKKTSRLVMQDLAEQGHPEACCYLGESYRFFEEEGEGDIEKAAKYFEAAAKAGLLRAKEALIFIYLDTMEIDKSLKYVDEAASEGSSVGIKFLGEFYLLNQYLPYNEEKGLGNLKLAFLLADFWALFSMCIYFREKLKEKSDIIPPEVHTKESRELYREKWEKKVFEYSQILYQCREVIGPIVHSTIRYGNIAECYEKGIHVEKDLSHAITYFEDFLANHAKEKKLAYIYYRMGVLYHKMENHNKAGEFFAKAFRARTQFIKSDARKETLHYYNYAKMLEKGLGVKTNVSLAKLYYKKGLEETPITFFTKLYYYKCKRRYEHLIEQEKKPFKILNTRYMIIKKEEFKLKLLDPQDIMLVSERKVTGQNDIETLEGIFGSLENLSVPLKLSRVIRIKDINFQHYMLLSAELWKLFSALNKEEIDGVRVQEIVGIAFAKKEMSQLIVGKEGIATKKHNEEGYKWMNEEDIDDIAEKYIRFAEFAYSKGWAYKILSVDSLRYEVEKRELVVDYLPLVVNIYNNIKGEKEKIPSMSECMISLLVYLKEKKQTEKSSMWKHEHTERDTLEESSMYLMIDPWRLFHLKMQEYHGTSKENLLALLGEVELRRDLKEKVLDHLGF